MSSQTPHTSPASTPAPHGGDMDPNEVRLRQARAQHASASSAHPANSPSVIAMVNPPHGGDMDPNEVRLRLARMQQTSGSSSPTANSLEPDNTVASHEPVQYGSSSHLINVPSSSPSGYNTYQTSQSQQSVHSGQYFPAQYGHQPSYPTQAQQSPQSPHPGSPTQGNVHYPMASIPPQSPHSGLPTQGNVHYPMAGIPPQSPHSGLPTQGNVNYPLASIPPQSPPGAPYASAPSYGPSQTWPVNKEASPDSGAIEAHAYYRGPAERGYMNTFHLRTQWRTKWPNTYQLPGIPRPGNNRRHRDTMQRAKIFTSDDYYLSPYDGHLAKLFVQSTQVIYDANPNSTWRRTFIRNQSPLILQVANWVLHSLPTDGREVKAEDLFMMGLKWIPSCVAILLLMLYPVQASGEIRNGGKYDSLPYKFWGYPYHARNPQEGKIEVSNQSHSLFQPLAASQPHRIQAAKSALNPISERPVEPKYLCFLKNQQGMETREVSQWKEEHSNEATYILVSYTSEQFKTEEEQLFLHDVGERAARAAGVQAYWVGCSCLGKTKEEQENNVWRISDVIRGARSLIIAVSNSIDKENPGGDMTALRQWGTRVWTLPEVLLIPSNSDIHVYARNAELDKPMTFHKRTFASLWGDASISRELIDHYEGNLILSSLELVTIALRCLHNRQKGFYLPGDMAYALMGLLRRRPTIVKTDSAFQAFARLSLANDNNLLLERLICILPSTPSQPWYEMEDQWGVSLWDVIPSTQVCGIADDDTVIIDGGYAAAIRWKAFAHVANLTRDSWRRFFFRYTFRSTSYLFIVGISLLANGVSLQNAEKAYGESTAGAQIYIAIGAIFLVIALCFVIFAPYVIRILYTGKIWGTQAWFFGFEGYMDISTIEQHVFGADMGHLKWSTNGSPLSVHAPNEYGECIGQDPTSNPETAEKVKRAIDAQLGSERIFTLVDTNTLTVTLFSAVRPPVAVVLCGEEGGMQRALLCSYDWSTQTLYRESVMRMDTLVLEKMARVGRLRLGLKRESL